MLNIKIYNTNVRIAIRNEVLIISRRQAIVEIAWWSTGAGTRFVQNPRGQLRPLSAFSPCCKPASASGTSPVHGLLQMHSNQGVQLVNLSHEWLTSIFTLNAFHRESVPEPTTVNFSMVSRNFIDLGSDHALSLMMKDPDPDRLFSLQALSPFPTSSYISKFALLLNSMEIFPVTTSWHVTNLKNSADFSGHKPSKFSYYRLL